MPVEYVRDPIGDGCVGRTEWKHFPVCDISGAVELVLAVHHADEHANLPVCQRRFAIARIFDCAPNGFKEEALLRVKRKGFARCDVKELRIEPLNIVQEATPLVRCFTGLPWFGIIEKTVIPTRFRDLDDAVSTVPQVLPELLKIIGHRITAEEPNDGNVVLTFWPRNRPSKRSRLRARHSLIDRRWRGPN